jgi:hypothetical protein
MDNSSGTQGCTKSRHEANDGYVIPPSPFHHGPPEAEQSWCFNRREKAALMLALATVLIFGGILEKRTALRNVPMTDLGVFACASWAVWHGQDLYQITDWNGWHYQYPPALALLFVPLAHPLPAELPKLPDGVARSQANTPWGFNMPGHRRFYGLHRQNVRFFVIVAAWYAVSVSLIVFSTHALACVLERASFRTPPPDDRARRRRWWALRGWPLIICLGSLGTELSRGQVDVVVLAAVSLGVYCTAANRDVSAGCCFALPATIKLFPPFLLLYPFWRRRRRMLAGVLAGLFLLLAVLPAVTLGPTRTIALYHSWIQVLAGPALGHGTDASRTRELTGMTSTDNQSLLAFIHNWRYWDIPRKKRPSAAMPAERYAVYGVGIALLIAIAASAGWRRQDQPRDLLLLVGLLIGLSFVISPIVHNYYYLVLLPLIAGLLDHALTGAEKVLWLLALFAAVDFLARLPGVGPALRDRGAPFLSLFVLMGAAAFFLIRGKLKTAGMDCQREGMP